MTTVTPPPADAEVRWLTCRIDKGMFSDELAVTYPSEGTWQKSVFVPASDVEGSPGNRGRVRVRIVRRNGHLMAVLPSSTQDIVTVNEGDVSPL
ncbi:MAG: hypothetical protein U0792_16945 [Gemmataceae bacterium]